MNDWQKVFSLALVFPCINIYFARSDRHEEENEKGLVLKNKEGLKYVFA